MGKTGKWKGRGLALAIAAIAVCLAVASCGSAPQTDSTAPRADDPESRREVQRRANRYDLAGDEERGGHTLQRHVARTDEELRERLERERNISAASTWTDRETAETTVAAALAAKRGRVDGWLRRGYPRPNLALHYNAEKMIGRSLRRGEETTVECTSAVVVLRADGPGGFYVLTTYPEARE